MSPSVVRKKKTIKFKLHLNIVKTDTDKAWELLNHSQLMCVMTHQYQLCVSWLKMETLLRWQRNIHYQALPYLTGWRSFTKNRFQRNIFYPHAEKRMKSTRNQPLQNWAKYLFAYRLKLTVSETGIVSQKDIVGLAHVSVPDLRQWPNTCNSKTLDLVHTFFLSVSLSVPRLNRAQPFCHISIGYVYHFSFRWFISFV